MKRNTYKVQSMTYIYIYIYLYMHTCIHAYIYICYPPPLPTFSLYSTRWVHCFGLTKSRFTEDGSVHAWRMAWPGRWAFFSLVIIQAKADRRWTWSLGLMRKICRNVKWTMCCTDFPLADDLQTIRSIWTWTIGPRCPNGSSDPYPLASTRTGLSAISCANACCRRDKTGWLL